MVETWSPFRWRSSTMLNPKPRSMASMACSGCSAWSRWSLYRKSAKRLTDSEMDGVPIAWEKKGSTFTNKKCLKKMLKVNTVRTCFVGFDLLWCWACDWFLVSYIEYIVSYLFLIHLNSYFFQNKTLHARSATAFQGVLAALGRGRPAGSTQGSRGVRIELGMIQYCFYKNTSIWFKPLCLKISR